MLIFKKISVIALWVLFGLTLFFVLANAVFRTVFYDFYKNAERTFFIPGMNSGFVTQGACDTGDKMLVSGYMKDHSSSRVYVLSEDGDVIDTVKLYCSDGTPYTTHSGGIAINGEYVYIAGDKYVEAFLANDILDGDGRATVVDVFDPGFDTAWVTVKDGYLLMGSFSDSSGEKYKPDAGEIFTTPTGEVNTSLVKIYRLDGGAENGIVTPAVAAISTGEKVQGLSFISDNELVLSTSYGLSPSRLILHRFDQTRVGTFKEGDADIPLFYLDSTTKTGEIVAPPMSEELIVKDGYVYIMNESASDKYIFGKFLGQYRCHRYKL